MDFQLEDFKVKTMGEPTVISPLGLSTDIGDGMSNYIADDERVPYKLTLKAGQDSAPKSAFEKAGPRERIFFEPSKIKAAIVTCGGLSPGLNDVIRSVVMVLYHRYKVRDIIGFRYGFRGLNPACGHYPMPLTPEVVDQIHRNGGTILGSSRGNQDKATMVETMVQMGVNILFCLGGDGTLKGAHQLWEVIEERKLNIAVIGIPKTIDNDINFVYKTFGFDTAVGIARDALICAHSEALGAPNGIALVKLMGRDSGFITTHATLACGDVNFALVPEIPFDLHGKGCFMESLEERLQKRGHSLVVVAEGAGQDLVPEKERSYDASGNLKLTDIGLFLQREIEKYFNERNVSINLKYIDPSYLIRSTVANANDSVYCANLAHHAVHAGMAGKTDVMIGLWHGVFTHVPLPLVFTGRKKIHPESPTWLSVLEATGQPATLSNRNSNNNSG